MKRKITYFWFFVILNLSFGPVLFNVDASVDSLIKVLVNNVSADSLDSTLRRMVTFNTRFAGSDSNTASKNYLAERLRDESYLKIQIDTFTVNVDRQMLDKRFLVQDLEQWNLVAKKPGVLFPEQQIVLGAHYDSISIDRNPEDQDLAPGADDNGSGVAALLEIIRILKRVDLDVTVVFVLFGAEELGLIGSRAYVSRAQKRGDQIVMMLQLDSIGSRSDLFPEAFTIDTIGPYLPQAKIIAKAAEDYTEIRGRTISGEQVLITSRGCQCSDHQSFIDAGYPGIGIFQYIGNPENHLNRSNDTLDQVDILMVEEVTRAVLAAVAQMAGFPGRSPDFNGDGKVGFKDFLQFARSFGQKTADALQYDLDRNGVVGFSDFLLFAERFGEVKG